MYGPFKGLYRGTLQLSVLCICLHTAGFFLYGIFNHTGILIHGFPVVFLRPGGAAKLHVSVPVEL